MEGGTKSLIPPIAPIGAPDPSGRWWLPDAPTRVGGMGHKARTEDGAEPLTTNTTDTTDRDVGAVLEQGAAA